MSLTAGHPIDAETRYTYDEFAKPIQIGDKVWIKTKALILPSVSIETDAVIGGGSIASKNIPENTVMVGNPDRIFRENINPTVKPETTEKST